MQHPLPLLAALCALSLTQAQAPEPTKRPERGLLQRSEGAFEGYTLFSPLRSTTTYLIDLEGEVVQRWESDYTPGNAVYLLDDGSLLRCCRVENDRYHGGGQGGHLQLMAWDGELLWDHPFSDAEKMQHHDIEPLPNGNVLVIAWEGLSAEEALALGRDPAHLDGDFWPDAVFELKPIRPDGAEIVWEWHARDHLIQDFDPEKRGYGDVTAHPERIDVNGDHRDEPPTSEADRVREAELLEEMRALGYVGDDEEEGEEAQRGERREPRRGGDWLHTNSIDYHPEQDLILLSSPNFNEFWVIDHSTTSAQAAGSSGGRRGRGGDLLYRWGNPSTYGKGTSADRRLFRQHDASWIETGAAGALRVLVFNNGGEGRRGYSSVDEIPLPFDPEQGFVRAADAAFGPTAPSWSYTAPKKEDFFSAFISGAQRLANGNTLICSGAQGRVFEVTAKKEIVWEYLNPFGDERPSGPPPGEVGGPPDSRPGGGPPGRRPGGGPPGGAGRGGPRGGGGMVSQGLFRMTRLAKDHPALAGRELAPLAHEKKPSWTFPLEVPLAR